MTSYTWQEIQSDWLVGSTLTLSPEEVEASFNRVVEKFGREWVQASRTTNGAASRGIQPTIRIATLGLMLKVLDRASDPSGLLEKIRDRQEDAWAELCAVYLVCSDKPDVVIELEPEITVSGRDPKPDFRIRSGNEPWTYAEVTVASRDSDAQRPILRSMERLTDLAMECPGNYALEVYLRREPRPDELALIESQIREHHLSAGTVEVELPSGLGTLYWNQHPPGYVFFDNHGGPYRPGLAVVKAPIIGGEQRQITVRWPFTDMRAEKMLKKKAKQLPADGPGIVMIQVSQAVGAMRAWQGIIQRRFNAGMHTRVSAVCLFRSSIQSSESSGHWVPECKVILNSRARVRLANWIVNQLERFPSGEDDIH